MYRRNRAARIFLLIFIIGPIAIFVFGFIVMWLWNNALVPVLKISEVTFWQALGILVLSKILFGSFSGGGRGRSNWGIRWRERMQQKWASMTPEERERFKEKYKDRWCYGNKPWESETAAVEQRTPLK